MRFPLRDFTSQYISSSYQDVLQQYTPSDIFYVLDGYGNVVFSLPSSSIGQMLIASNMTASMTVASASYAITQSYYDVKITSSSSFASSSISASYSYSSSHTENADNADFALASYYSTTTDTASYSDRSLTASYAENAIGFTLESGSFYPISSSWAQSASFWDSSSILNLLNNKQPTISTGSLLPITSSVSISSSYTFTAISSSYALTSSYALNGGTTGTTLTTGSTYPFTSSWAQSASFWDSSSIVSLINTKQNTITTGSTFAITASVSTSASFAITASYYNQLWLSTGSSYPITSSWAQSASFWDSSSIVSLIGTKQNTITSGSTLAITASVSTSASYALTSSYALNGGIGGTTLITGSTYSITSSWAQSASFWDSSSIISLIDTKQNVIVTSSFLPITASISVTSSYALNSISSSFTVTASYALNVETTNHNSLLGLQGGITNEYYHLPSSSYVSIINGSSSYALTSSYASSANTSNSASYILASNVSGYPSQIVSSSITASVGGPQIFAIVSSSTNVLYISSSGQVNINTTNPSQAAKLYVSASKSQKSAIFEGTDSSGYNIWVKGDTAGFLMGRSGNSGYVQAVNGTGGSSAHFACQTLADSRMGVGAVVPNAKMQVAADSVVAGIFSVTSASVNLLTVSASGNISIGPATPVNRLDVSGNISASIITASLFFGTASFSNNATSASYALNGGGGPSISASYASTSSWANNLVITSSAQTTGSYTLVAEDLGKVITFTNATTNSIVIPSGLPTNFNCFLVSVSTGSVLVTGSGVVLNNANNCLRLSGRYAAASIIGYLPDSYILTGDTSI